MPGESEDYERWTVQLADGDELNLNPEKMGRVEGELLSVWRPTKENDD